MPKYTNPDLTSWKDKGYFEFMDYEQFKNEWNNLTSEIDKVLLTLFFFTGARPSELIEIERKNTRKDKRKIIIGIPTKKRREDEKIRFIKLNLKYEEIKHLWEYIKDMPDSFFILGELRNYKRFADYCYYHLKKRPYFFRHNIMSLLSIKGATLRQIQRFKGSARESSVYPYLHLSKIDINKISSILDKAIN